MLTTVKLKLNSLNKKQQYRLKKILARDTRIIKKIINLIKENEDILVNKSKRGNYYIRRKDMVDLFVSTSNREEVKHDLKAKFIRISHNELVECIDTAREIYSSYLQLQKQQDSPSLPTIEVQDNYVPRSIGYRRFSLSLKTKSIKIMDSLDSNLQIALGDETKVRHDYLRLPLRISPYHINRIREGKPKSVKIYRHDDEFWISIAVEVDVREQIIPISLPFAVLGIDLGINKQVSTALITGKGLIESKTFHDRNRTDSLNRVERRIGKLQQQTKFRDITRVIDTIAYRSGIGKLRRKCRTIVAELKKYQSGKIEFHRLKKQVTRRVPHILNSIDQLLADSQKKKILKKLHNLKQILEEVVANLDGLKSGPDALYRKLKQLRHSRANIKQDLDRQLARQLADYINDLSIEYNIYCAIGDVSGIRKAHQRGSGNRYLRKIIHQWSFSRFTSQLAHNLNKMGITGRLFETRESWTSIMCYKCNKRGVRPKQCLFICQNPECGLRINADVNGAVNIAKRAIKYNNLVPNTEYTKFNIPNDSNIIERRMKRKNNSTTLNKTKHDMGIGQYF